MGWPIWWTNPAITSSVKPETELWRSNLNAMNVLLNEVRGIPLSAFDSYADLQRLQLLANACRHGEGDSAVRIYKHHPELWPDWPPLPMMLPGQTEPYVYTGPPTFDRIVVPRQWWRDFVDAIVWFWEDVEIIHGNSLPDPNPGAGHRLAALHQARAGSRKTKGTHAAAVGSCL